MADIEKRVDCEWCGNLHASPDDCNYPTLRAIFGDVSADEDRFLRWMAHWDLWTVEQFMRLISRQPQRL